MSESSKNTLDKSREIVWIPYHDRVNRAPSISFPSTTIRYNYLVLEVKGLSCNNNRSLLDQEIFIKWDNGGTLAERNYSVNARFMSNGKKEDVIIFRIYLQENIMEFHPNYQVCESKLQSYTEPFKVGYVI